MPKASSTRRVSGPKAAPRKRSDPYPKDSPSSTTTTATASVEPSTTTTTSSHLAVILPDHLPVYDTCSTVRRKLTAFLASSYPIPGELKANGSPKPYTQKKLCEHLGLTQGSLARFMRCEEGEMHGAQQGVYVKAYAFLERLRIHLNEPKSPERIRLEKKSDRGLDLKDPHKGPIWVMCRADEDPNDFLSPPSSPKLLPHSRSLKGLAC